jgi:hypothetical protein
MTEEIRDGVYKGKVLGWALGKASTGKEQLVVTFALVDADGTHGPSIDWYGYFTDATVDRTIQSLRVLGWKGDDLSDLSSIEDGEAQLVIESEEYKGKVKPRVRWINALEGPSLKDQLSPEEAKSFAQRMKSRVRAADAVNGQPKATGKPANEARPARKQEMPPEPPPRTDEDPFGGIPF